MSREIWQLTLDGREVPAAGDEPTNPNAPLSRAQRAILAHLRDEGAITPTEAGLVLHRAREQGCSQTFSPAAEGCCKFCASDGSAALKRLEKRGLVYRPMVGLWEPIARQR